MRTSRLLLPRADVLVPASGAAATLFAAYLSVAMGLKIGFGLVVLVSLFVGSVLGFLLAPHVMVAITIPVFALIPAAKLFVSPQIGPLKDLLSLAAIVVTVAFLVLERRPGRRRALPDSRVLLAVAFLLGLYVVNVGSGHDIAWAQGVRLTGEPFLLLVAGLTLPDPRRTLRFAAPALVATGCLEATYGLLQQALGPWRLQSFGHGYSFATNLRTYHGHLRSFGTMSDPFGYAAFLLFAFVVVLFWMKRGPLAAACGVLLLAGVAASYERTAILILIALLGLWIGRKGYTTSAVLVLAAAAAAAGANLVTSAGGSQTTSYESQTSSLTLNGRISAWKAALGSPRTWPLGQGVGVVGTAAERATYTLAPGAHHEAPTRAVDSGYLSTIADVGLVGLAVLLALLGRLIALGRAAVARAGPGRRRDAGWVGLGLLFVLMLDAVTRSSFTGFPTAFLGLLLVGVALAAATQADRSAQPEAAARSRR